MPLSHFNLQTIAAFKPFQIQLSLFWWSGNTKDIVILFYDMTQPLIMKNIKVESLEKKGNFISFNLSVHS